MEGEEPESEVKEELERLISEKRHPKTINIDELSTIEILKIINEEDKKVAYAIEKVLPEVERAVEEFVRALKSGGRVFYVGAGTSGRLGVIDAAELIPTFGMEEGRVQAIIAGGPEAMFKPKEGAEDDELVGEEEMVRRRISKKDFVIGLSASGRTPFVIGALKKARELGAKTAIISVNPDCKAAKHADIKIFPIVGEEVITGSTRMKAGTAEKMLLTMMSTAAMIRLGRVKSNLMVNLLPLSRKLRERAKRIVMEATGVGYEKAAETLERTGYDVEKAIELLKSG
ncbi:MAG TPA: N-acetylmuramic acid 6-phosphate etherase [Candidatus Korarchaeota archaeon]|nr:N-acetylmuramic acid 6-phosphate etherase [Candidatus Korarchaeota archaeon]